MAELLILEFDGIDEAGYKRVNAELGIDMTTGAGDWPNGMITHLAGLADSGTFYVIEAWESQQAQEEFMHGRLGAALAAGGITAVPKVTWARLVGHQAAG